MLIHIYVDIICDIDIVIVSLLIPTYPLVIFQNLTEICWSKILIVVFVFLTKTFGEWKV